ncbi:dynamin family protein [Caballeronia sp. 15711]|uniref:dynamin family protein n=1 Tax=Caballeronia sp. 15711 TaxID=3391029 RepID=UPI0039E4C4A2
MTHRQRKVQVAKDYLDRTEELFSQFGSSELKSVHARFADLRGALEATAAQIVVLGEFTRGKSRMLNSLLGIELLPYALETTTAVNTFLRGLPRERQKRYIVIHYIDGRQQEMAWEDDDALRRWGTELDTSNRDGRKTVSHIDVFLDHPLLRRDLVLVDTPGLQTVVKHHEQITRKAIDGAHIALWVQSTDMLGGSESEWNFLTDNLQNNFRKFITVINKWDKVLDPEDKQDKETPEAERVKAKLDIIKENFAQALGATHPQELATMTDKEHLLPVSATWGEDADAEKRRRSGMDELRKRIAAMVSSGEAMQQILYKPLQQLSTVQKQLAERVSEELRQLESAEPLDKQRHQLARLEMDVRDLEQEEERETRDSREEHERAGLYQSETVLAAMTAPISSLKNVIQDRITETYIARQLAADVSKIALPPDLEAQLADVAGQLGQQWKEQKKKIAQTLAGLRANYVRRMEKHALQIESELGKIHIELPRIESVLDLDFSSIEEHRSEISKLKSQMDRTEDELHELEREIATKTVSDRKRVQAEADLARLAARLDSLGPPPPMERHSVTQKISDWGSGFLWLSPTYETVTMTDDAALLAHQRESQGLQRKMESKEEALARIIQEEEELTGQRISAEMAKKRLEKQQAKLAKEAERAKNAAALERQTLVAEGMRKLSRNTVTKLDDTIVYLNQHLAAAVRAVFVEQAQLLASCVQEQLMEPLNAKRAQRQEVQLLLQQSVAEIAARKAKLQEGSVALTEVINMTQAVLND